MSDIKLIREVSCGTAVAFPLFVRWEEKQVDTSLHKHDFTELVIIVSGNGEHEFCGSRTVVRTGDVFVIPRGSFHAYKNCSSNFSLSNILYVPESISMPLLDITFLPGYEALYLGKCSNHETYPLFHPDGKDFSVILELANELRRESESRQPAYQFNMLGLFMSLLGKLIRIYSHEIRLHHKHYLNTVGVITYLNRNFRKKIDIMRLCSIAKMSKASLIRNFFRATGTTPLQYQIQLRIAEAVILLRTTNKCLIDIAYEVGFEDSNYFGRQFKRIIGISPGKYRERHF